MEFSEYTTMFGLEDRHWWYVGLRQLLLSLWARHVRAERPAVLDVGCGTGANLIALNGVAAKLAGIDFAPEAVRFCRTRGLACTAVASALLIPFGAGGFAVWVSLTVSFPASIRDRTALLGRVHLAPLTAA